MTPPKATAKKPVFSFGDFGKINGEISGQKPGKVAAKPAPAKPKSTPVQNNETSRSGIILMKGLFLTDKERGKALAHGKKSAAWHPAVGSAYVQGTYTPKGVKPLRPADGSLPVRATGSVSRPAGKGPAPKAAHIPTLNASMFPREVPSPAKTLSMGLSYGLGKGNYDSGYFTDAADLK